MQDAFPPHFPSVARKLNIMGWERGHVTLTIERSSLVALISKLISEVSVDEDWYLQTYPDVRDAVAAGRIANARQHYLTNGYFEGRLPNKYFFDAADYVSRYPDLLDEIGNDPNDLFRHFSEHGYAEGRLPRAS